MTNTAESTTLSRGLATSIKIHSAGEATDETTRPAARQARMHGWALIALWAGLATGAWLMVAGLAYILYLVLGMATGEL